MQNLILNAAQSLGDFVYRSSTIKQILLFIFMMVSLSRATEWDNEATLRAVCDNSTMHLSVNFTNEFRGAVYQSRNYFHPRCSYTVPLGMNVTELELSMHFGTCDIKVEQVENKTIASTEVVIQMHNLLDSVYDRTVNVSCEINNYYPNNETEIEYINPYAAPGLDLSWIEFKNGLFLFGEVGEPTESSLFLVVGVRDDGSSQDMLVQNCIAHTDKNITNATTLLQLSNFYGCSDPSAILANFTVIPRENPGSALLAYAPIANFSLLVSLGRMSVSCGITLCENACPANCNDTESPVQLPLSEYATKDVVRRGSGAQMPDSLRELNRHNDRSRRAVGRPKRSISSFLNNIFHWESRVMTNSAFEGNVTNVTSFGMAKGLLVERSVYSRDVLASSKKHVNGNLTNSLVGDDSCVDWQTFRFIALLTICLFVTVVAFYCCYADDSKKTKNTPYVF